MANNIHSRQSVILTKKQLMVGLALLFTSNNGFLVRAQDQEQAPVSDIQQEEFIQSNEQLGLTSYEALEEQRVKTIRLNQVPYVTNPQQVVDTKVEQDEKEHPNRQKAKEIIQKGLEKRKNAANGGNQPHTSTAQFLEKAFSESQKKLEKENKEIEVEVKVMQDPHALANGEDVDKSKIKLEHVKAPGAASPAKPQPQPQPQPKPAQSSVKKSPFTINITVNEDSVKIDSSHPDIGSKTIPVNQKSSGQPTPSVSAPVPVPAKAANVPKQASSSEDFDFEPATNGEIVDPATVSAPNGEMIEPTSGPVPVPAQQTPVKSVPAKIPKAAKPKQVQPAKVVPVTPVAPISTPPSNETPTVPIEQPAQPIVANNTTEQQPIQPVTEVPVESVVPSAETTEGVVASNTTEVVNSSGTPVVEVVPTTANTPVEVVPTTANTPVEVVPAAAPSTPVVEVVPTTANTPVEVVPATAPSTPVVEVVPATQSSPVEVVPASQSTPVEVVPATASTPVVEVAPSTQTPVTSSSTPVSVETTAPVQQSTIAPVVIQAPLQQPVKKTVVKQKVVTVKPASQVPQPVKVNSVASVKSSDVPSPTQTQETPLQPASGTTIQSKQNEESGKEEIVPLPALTKPQPVQGTPEAQTDEKMIPVQKQKLPVKTAKKVIVKNPVKPIVQKPIIQPIIEKSIIPLTSMDPPSELTPSQVPVVQPASEETTIETKNTTTIIPLTETEAPTAQPEGFNASVEDTGPPSPVAKKTPYTKENAPHPADPVVQPVVVKTIPLPPVDPTKPQVEPTAEQAGLPSEPLIVKQQPVAQKVIPKPLKCVPKPEPTCPEGTVPEDSIAKPVKQNSTSPSTPCPPGTVELEAPVVSQNVTKKLPKKNIVKAAPQKVNGTKKILKVPIIKKPVQKVVPKKKVIVKSNTTKKCVPVVNTTKVENTTDVIANDTDVIDKKNKIEYLENLEKDLEEAKAKITKQKQELQVKKAKKLVNKSKEAKKVNATKLLNKTGTLKSSDTTSDLNATTDVDPITISNETLPTNSTPSPLTDEDVKKVSEDGKDIVKDQEINEADKILETMNNTINIEKDSSTGPVVDADSITNKKNITQEAIENETINSNKTIIETKDKSVVVGSQPLDPESVNTNDAAPVVAQPIANKKKAKLTPHQTNPVPRASDTKSVWPSQVQVNAPSNQMWDASEVFKTFNKKEITNEQKFEKEQSQNKQKLLLQKSIELENKLRNEDEIRAIQDDEDKQEDEAVRNQIDFDLARISIKKKQMESQRNFQMQQQKQIDDEAVTTMDSSPISQYLPQQFVSLQQQKAMSVQKDQALQKAQKQAQIEEKAQIEAAEEIQKKQQEEINQAEKIKAQALSEQQNAEAIKQQAEAERIAKSKVESSYQEQRTKMNQEMDKFSVNLNVDHLNKAIQIQKDIAGNEDFSSAGFKNPDFKVHTSDVFKNSFTFPQISLNDFAQEQLQKVSKSEQDLNKNLSDQNSIKAFIDTAKEVSGQLSSRYQSQWVNPNQDSRNSAKSAAGESNDDDNSTNAMQNALQKKVDKQSTAQQSQSLPQYEQFESIVDSVAGSRMSRDLEQEGADSDLVQYMDHMD